MYSMLYEKTKGASLRIYTNILLLLRICRDVANPARGHSVIGAILATIALVVGYRRNVPTILRKHHKHPHEHRKFPFHRSKGSIAGTV